MDIEVEVGTLAVQGGVIEEVTITVLGGVPGGVSVMVFIPDSFGCGDYLFRLQSKIFLISSRNTILWKTAFCLRTGETVDQLEKAT